MSDATKRYSGLPPGSVEPESLGDLALAAAGFPTSRAGQGQTVTYRTDASDRLEWISEQGASLLGYADAHALVGQPASLLYRTPGERAASVSALIRQGGVVWREETLRRSDGTPVAARSRFAERREAQGAPGGMVAHSQILPGDLTARLKLAQALREMEAIFNNALVGMLVVKNGRIEKSNRLAAETFGYGPDGLLGVEAAALFRDRGEWEAYWTESRPELIRSGAHVGECEFVCRDGDSILARNHARTIVTGEVESGIVWAFEDITESRRLEEALRAAKKAAEAANLAKTQFLSNMTHELRTPLNGILGLVQLLLDTATDGESRECLHTIRQSTRTLMNIVGDLLDLSEVESGRLRLVERPFDPRAELEPLLRGFASQSQTRAFVFSHQLEASLPASLVGDCGHIKQILVNLIGNAFKYTQHGMVEVRVGLTEGDSSPVEANAPRRARLVATVSDTGIGIEPRRLSTIFEPFGIGEDYLTKKYSGAGLGLAIAKKLAGMMGGDITVESEPGRGSTFVLTLVCTVPHPGERPDFDAGAGRARRLRVLVAEDEPVNRVFLVRVLEKLGHTVEAAVDGREALVLLENSPFDLILMDVQMPRLNGLDLARRIRAGQVPGVAAGIPIVALSAYAMSADLQRGFAAGMDEYVTKPFEPCDLEAAMARALARQDGGTFPAGSASKA